VNLGELAALALLIGAFLPAMWMASHGQPRERLVGFEFAGITAVMVIMLLSIAWQRDSDLTVSLVLALVAVPGTLVFARLLVGKS
jgi:multisubunit Na+/H+ antiporter MnhF subunit